MFALVAHGGGLRVLDRGRRVDACREPINVNSNASDPSVRMISNFAHTPFEPDGERYASVEGFWQGLRYSDEDRRRAIAGLHGPDARAARNGGDGGDEISYAGRVIRGGTADHWDLMLRACRAKFAQHQAAPEALLATGERPRTLSVGRDSRTIPGVIMVRSGCGSGASCGAPTPDAASRRDQARDPLAVHGEQRRRTGAV